MYYKEMRILFGMILAYLAINLIASIGLYLCSQVIFPNHYFHSNNLIVMNFILEGILLIGIFAMLIKNSLGIKRELIIKNKGKKYFFKLFLIQLGAASLISALINSVSMLFCALYITIINNSGIAFISGGQLIGEYIQLISLYICVVVLIVYLKDKLLNTMKKYTSRAACISQMILTIVRIMVIGILFFVLTVALSQVRANYGSLYFLYYRFTNEQLMLLAPALTLSFVVDYYRFYINEVIV